MKIVIIGKKWLAAQLLEQCVLGGHEVLRVVSPTGDRLEAAAKNLGIENVAIDSVPSCDVILCANAHIYVCPATRSKAIYGAFGYHPSLLPRHRGKDAIRWAIHMKETATGGTVYQLDDGADTGPIAVQDWCHILPADTPQSIWKRELGPMGLKLFAQLLQNLTDNTLMLLVQDKGLATWEPAFNTNSISENKTI